METRDNTPLVGGLLVALAIIGLIILGAITLAGRGPGDEVELETGSQQAPPAASSQSQDRSASTEVREGRVDVDIDNSVYVPATLTVKRGTTVTWTNRDTVPHDVTPEDSEPDVPRSDMLSQGQSYRRTFDTTGTFNYYCSIHPFMKGSVTVVD